MARHDLAKKAKHTLEKRGGTALAGKVRAGMVFDISGSMADEYQTGLVQAISDRFLGLALALDSTGEMEAWKFANGCQPLEPITDSNADGYVARMIGDPRRFPWGTETNYAPPLRAARERWFPNAPEPATDGGAIGLLRAVFRAKRRALALAVPGEPSLLIFKTDGDNHDRTDARGALAAIRDLPLYVEFVGIGRQDFGFIRDVAGEMPNVGFLHLPEPRALDDDRFYDALVTPEMVAKLKGFTET